MLMTTLRLNGDPLTPADLGGAHAAAWPSQLQPYLPIVAARRRVVRPDRERHAEDPLHGGVEGAQDPAQHPGARKLVLLQPRHTALHHSFF